MIIKIKRARDTKKDKLYLSLPHTEREQVVRETILSLPAGTYLLTTKGMASPNLPDTVGKMLGTFAGTDVTERMLLGLAATEPERISTSLTLGLDEIIIKSKINKRTKE